MVAEACGAPWTAGSGSLCFFYPVLPVGQAGYHAAANKPLALKDVSSYDLGEIGASGWDSSNAVNLAGVAGYLQTVET